MFDTKFLLPTHFNPPTPRGVGHQRRQTPQAPAHFNPPTPRGVGLALRNSKPRRILFQSTHPAWGGTQPGGGHQHPRAISIHPPRVGWDGKARQSSIAPNNFNPPTPRGVGRRTSQAASPRNDFNPPTPRGVGPSTTAPLMPLTCISIHPPRVGWDPPVSLTPSSLANFNPPTPRGVGLLDVVNVQRVAYFNPPTPRGVGR